MSQSLKVIFAGTPDFAARHLQALINSQHEIVAVYTQPDRPAGRGKKLQASAVKQLALEHELVVEQPASLKAADAQQQLAQYNADVMVVVAYGLLLPKVVLDTPRLGCINVHGSLLPRWRGAAPIQRAVEAGDAESGVTIMQMDEGLDTGPMLLKASLPLASDETSASLYDKLAASGPTALLQVLENLGTPACIAEAQNDAEANYARKLSKAESVINWHKSAEVIERQLRAFTPWPGLSLRVDADGEEHTVKVHQLSVVTTAEAATPGAIIRADKNGIVVATAEHAICLHSLQLPGKKAMPVADILNARAEWFSVGQQLPQDNAE